MIKKHRSSFLLLWISTDFWIKTWIKIFRDFNKHIKQLIQWDIRSHEYLKSSQLESDGHVQGFVDHPGHRLDQGHEEQREPDDADEQHDDHAPHPILHHLLLLLPPRLRVALQGRAHTQTHNYLSVCPRAAVATDVAYYHRYDCVWMITGLCKSDFEYLEKRYIRSNQIKSNLICTAHFIPGGNTIRLTVGKRGRVYKHL